MDLSNCENDTFIFNNISTTIQNCECFSYSELISLYTNLKQNSTFSTLAVNTRSLRTNFEKLELCLEILTISFDCIGLTDTWLTDHDDVIVIT